MSNNNNAAARALKAYLSARQVPANFRLPANATPASDSMVVSQLGQLAKLNVHGYGLIIREIPTAVLACLNAGQDWSDAQWKAALYVLEQAARGGRQQLDANFKAYLKDYGVTGGVGTIEKRFRVAHMVREQMMTSTGAQGLCREPLGGLFVTQFALGDIRPGTTYIAFKLLRRNGQLAYRAVALGSFSVSPTNIKVWGTATRNFVSKKTNIEHNNNNREAPEFTASFDNKPQWTEWLQQGRIAEIDLMCSREKGAGSALLSYMLARIAARKRSGQRRFKGVVTYLAGGGDTLHTNRPTREQFPFLPAVTAAGFTQARVKLAPIVPNTAAGPSRAAAAPRNPRERIEPYFATFDGAGSTWVQRTVDRLMALDPHAAIKSCPTVPKTGRTYCV